MVLLFVQLVEGLIRERKLSSLCVISVTRAFRGPKPFESVFASIVRGETRATRRGEGKSGGVGRLSLSSRGRGSAFALFATTFLHGNRLRTILSFGVRN